jgi:16S rRNA pseudouridine516 synthase
MARYYMFNKPRGCISATTDARQKTVLDYFPPQQRQGLFNVGRLDKDTEGFLIITDDGKLSFDLMMPEHKVPKKYFFHALLTSKEEVARERLTHIESGINIYADRDFETAPAKLDIEKYGHLSDVIDFLPENERKITERKGALPVISGYLTITEGKKHQVKRMIRYAGYKVIYLKRVSINGVLLDENLSPGEYRALTEEELAILKSRADG